MLAAVGQGDGLDQRHVQDVAVEFHRLAHVATDEGQVVDAVRTHEGLPLLKGSSELQDNLAEMFAVAHRLEGRLGVLEGEYLVHHRLDAM